MSEIGDSNQELLSKAKEQKTEQFINTSRMLLRPTDLMATLYIRNEKFENDEKESELDKARKYIEQDSGLRGYEYTDSEIKTSLRLLKQYRDLCNQYPYTGEKTWIGTDIDQVVAREAYNVIEVHIARAKNDPEFYGDKNPFEVYADRTIKSSQEKAEIRDDDSMTPVQVLEENREDRVQRAFDNYSTKTADARAHYVQLISKIYSPYYQSQN